MTILLNQLRKKIILILFIGFLLLFPISATASVEEAIFAGGCFWCLEHDLEEINGIIDAESGYSGGKLINPNYQKHDGHQESVKVVFDNAIIEYKDLLRAYWRNIDPFDGQGQFCDRGDSYRPVIFPFTESQKREAIKSVEHASNELNKSLKDLKVEIKESTSFWIAEDYHQDFAINNSFKYNFYRYSCGRDARLDSVWGSKARSSDSWTPEPQT